MTTLSRTLAVIACAVIAVAATMTGGARDARAGELRTDDSADPIPTTTGAVNPDADPLRAGPDPVADAARPSPVPGVVRVPAPVVRVAEPWCRSGRVAGSGTGFCLIN